MPLPGHKKLFKGTDGKFIAHAADVIGDGTFSALLIRQLHIEIGHPVHVGQVVLVELGNDVVHLLLFLLGAAVHVDGGVHKVPQSKECLLLLTAYPHISLTVGQDTVDHSGDSL